MRGKRFLPTMREGEGKKGAAPLFPSGAETVEICCNVGDAEGGFSIDLECTEDPRVADEIVCYP